MNMITLDIVGIIQAAIIGSTQLIILLGTLVVLLVITSRGIMKNRKKD